MSDDRAKREVERLLGPSLVKCTPLTPEQIGKRRAGDTLDAARRALGKSQRGLGRVLLLSDRHTRDVLAGSRDVGLGRLRIAPKDTQIAIVRAWAEALTDESELPMPLAIDDEEIPPSRTGTGG